MTGGWTMTGPEHYREAEELLDTLRGRDRGTVPHEVSIAAEAQVHAVLALAAATALSGISMPDDQAWRDVAATSTG